VSHWKTLFPSLYLGAHDLQGRDVALTIRRVVAEEVKTEKGSERKAIVYFVETGKKAKPGEEEKRLVLNKTNAKTVAKLYGSEMNDWTGKRITLFPSRVSAFGEEVEAIRVRPVPPAPAPSPETKEEPK
jgi:hypothetical protein